MGRRRKKDPRRHQFCLRLNDREMELLEAYTRYRDMDTEVDAIRHMISGLESWLARRRAEEREHHPPSLHQSNDPYSGMSINSTATDVDTDVDTDGHDESINDGEASLGDFAGHPRVELPGMPGGDDP